MKTVTSLLLLLTSLNLFAQVKLNDKDFKNLVAIAQVFANDVNANTDGFDAAVKKLSTPKLKHIVDTFTLLDGGNKELLSQNYLGRPQADELQLWYAISEVQDSRNDSLNKKTDEQIAKQALARKVDERILVHTYYRMLEGGVAFLSNEIDMSTVNIDIDKLGLKNDTEKGIFFLNMAHALVTRFRVLNQMQNPEKLLEFAAKLPQFNGKAYYTYTAFSYPDFEYSNQDGVSTYNTIHVGDYYEALMSHFMAIADKGGAAQARDIYFNSIMAKPEYFKYSSVKDMLQEVYNDASKK